MAHHRLTANPETCHWGWFEAGLPPRLTVRSGDTVTIETVTGGPEQIPPDGFHVPPKLREIHARPARIECCPATF